MFYLGRSASATGITVNGKIKHGGIAIDGCYRQNIAYVMQDDALAQLLLEKP